MGGAIPERYAHGRLGDFAFVSLDVEGGRLIGGFATARNLSPSHFQKAAGTE